MRRDSFIFYTSWIESTDAFPEEQQAEIIFSLVRYCAYGIVPDLSIPHVKMAYMMNKTSIDRNYQRYARRKQKNNQESTNGEPVEDQETTNGEPVEDQCKGVYVYDDVYVYDNPSEDKSSSDVCVARAQARRTQPTPSNNKKSQCVKDNPPTTDDVTTFMREYAAHPPRNHIPYTLKDEWADDFVDYYTAKGWLIGRNTPMRDWHAAAQRWVRENNAEQQDYTQQRRQTLLQDDTPYGRFNDWLFREAPYLIAHCEKLLTQEQFYKLREDVGRDRMATAVKCIESNINKRRNCAVLDTAIRETVKANLKKENPYGNTKQ